MALSRIVPLTLIAGCGAALFIAGRLPDPRALVGSLMRWQAWQRQRRALRALDDRLLDDIGLSRGQAEAEGRRHD